MYQGVVSNPAGGSVKENPDKNKPELILNQSGVMVHFTIGFLQQELKNSYNGFKYFFITAFTYLWQELWIHYLKTLSQFLDDQ